MPVLGEILVYFSEFKEKFRCFTAKVQVGAGISDRTYLPDVIGILQYLKGGGTDNDSGAVYATEKPYLWTKAELPNLAFIERPNELYRIVGNNDWSREGGFYRYDLQKWQGIADTQKTDESIDFSENYY